jgi:hypothetical protein
MTGGGDDDDSAFLADFGEVGHHLSDLVVVADRHDEQIADTAGSFSDLAILAPLFAMALVAALRISKIQTLNLPVFSTRPAIGSPISLHPTKPTFIMTRLPLFRRYTVNLQATWRATRLRQVVIGFRVV